MRRVHFPLVAVATCAFLSSACTTTADPPLRLGKSLESLQSLYGDGSIRFEYLSESDEGTFTGVLAPTYAMLDERAGPRGYRRYLIQCKVQSGKFVKCQQLVDGKELALETIYGYKVSGLQLQTVGTESFVKLRQPSISFYGYLPAVDLVSNLSEAERKSFSGQVHFYDTYENYAYDIVGGVAVKVAVSTEVTRKWP